MDFTKVVSDGYASGESTCSTDTGVCCCLAWRLPKATQASIRKEQLRALHIEIASFRELVGAVQIEVSATAGALQCKDSRHLAISAEDVALRLGQLLCGWCSSQDPAIELTVGMHTGGLDIVHLPGGQRLFVGSALLGASELATEAPKTRASLSKRVFLQIINTPRPTQASILKLFKDCGLVIKLFASGDFRTSLTNRLLVIGCGPAGIQIVRNLWSEFDLTLVEPKDYYEYTPGILRGLCDQEHLESLQVPLSQALDGFQLRHIRGKVTQLHERSAIVAPCSQGPSTPEFEVVEFDYAVIAAGSRYVGSSHWKVGGDDAAQQSREGRQQGLAALRARLVQRAERGEPAVLLGGGLVGVELAAELAHFMPSLQVILVDKCARPLPTMPADAQDYAESWLRDHGIDLRLGKELPREERPLLEALGVREAEVLQCTGLSMCCDFAADLRCRDGYGQLRTNRSMQVLSSEPEGNAVAAGHIFALGDCVSVQGTTVPLSKDIYPAEAMAEVVTANLRNLLQSNSELQELPAQLWELTLCSLGPDDCIFIMNGRVMATGWMAVQMKHQVEVTKMGQMKQEMWGRLVWSLIPHW
ncbi:unnamed protein product [Symbiodinium natans]|uniref:FAD/NAD(P)-binding domain-containing protein n=1 Tax=Symbiodinium natans TaxID=878477 RepID=A0A812STK0_9DINO|nr:unnamed protein product [Symbiodinium natans]